MLRHADDRDLALAERIDQSIGIGLISDLHGEYVLSPRRFVSSDESFATRWPGGSPARRR